MGSRDEKNKFLDEHVAYELQMLRYTHGRMQSETDPLLWNTLMESFCIHARNLHAFLVNKRGRGSKAGKSSTNNFKAKDFSKTYKVDQLNALKGPLLSRVDLQLFHMGKQRGNVKNVKLDRKSDIKNINQWVENDLKDFAEAIKKEGYPTDWLTEYEYGKMIIIPESPPDSSAKATSVGTASREDDS